jgi:hypothetical protein
MVRDIGIKETGILVSCSDYHIFKKLNMTRKQAFDHYLGVVKQAFEAGISPARKRSIISGEMKVKFSIRETVAVVEPIASATVLRLEYVPEIIISRTAWARPRRTIVGTSLGASGFPEWSVFTNCILSICDRRSQA